MARQSLKSLLGSLIEQVQGSPVPIRSIEYDPTTKRLKVDFVERTPVAAAPAAPAPAEREQPIKYVAGTDIPDDESPISMLDVAMSHPSYVVD